MSRQNNNTPSDRRPEEQRKNPLRAVRSAHERTGAPDDRSRADNTRVIRMDPRKMNDLYERSSI